MPPRQPLPVELQLVRITAGSERGGSDEAVEVLVTNTGSGPLAIPTGTADELLSSDMKDRRILKLSVQTQSKPVVGLGGASAKSNNSHLESSTILRQGECLVFKLPLALQAYGPLAETPVQIRVVASIAPMVNESGTDYNEQISDEVVSINTLTWAPHGK